MKYILMAILCLGCYGATAQSGFFIQPEIGLGGANAHVSYFHTSSTTAYTGQLGVGYHLGGIEINSGICVLRAGYTFDNYYNAAGPVDFKQTIYNTFVMVPLVFAAHIEISNRLSIIPGIGLQFSRMASEAVVIDSGGHTSRITIGSNALTAAYDRNGLWGVLQARAGYQLTRQLELVAGPQAQYMLKSMTRGVTYGGSLKEHAYTFTAGIILNLKREKSPKRKVTVPHQ